jgi:putative membrane protein
MIRSLSAMVAALAAAFTAIPPALAQTTTTDLDPVWMWRTGWGIGGMMFGGGLLMLLFWGGIILLIVLLVRRVGGVGPHDMRQPMAPMPPPAAPPARPRALDILDERYARGEIDKAEYDERRKTLTGAQS